MKVTKEFRFESAHRLSNYVGKCSRPHGHNYRGLVTATGELDSIGMVIDFGDLKGAFNKYIVAKFDHKLILKKDKENKKYFGKLPKDWVVWVDYNPTAENMARDFLSILQEVIPQVSKVEVFETDDSSASFGSFLYADCH